MEFSKQEMKSVVVFIDRSNARAFRTARRSWNVTQIEAAKRFGVSQSTLSKIETSDLDGFVSVGALLATFGEQSTREIMKAGRSAQPRR